MTEINTVPQGEKREQKTGTTEPGDKAHMGSKGENDFQASGLGDWARRLREKDSMWGRYTRAEPRTETEEWDRRAGVREENFCQSHRESLVLCSIWLAITPTGKPWSDGVGHQGRPRAAKSQAQTLRKELNSSSFLL